MQIEEESLPQAWGRLLQLLNVLPDHPLKKNEILDIFYNGLTDSSRDHLDSCASCDFKERTDDQAELLLNNMLSNENDWTLPEEKWYSISQSWRYARGKEIYEEKGIKAKDVKNLPPIEEMHAW